MTDLDVCLLLLLSLLENTSPTKLYDLTSAEERQDDVILCGRPETAGEIQQRGLEDFSTTIL